MILPLKFYWIWFQRILICVEKQIIMTIKFKNLPSEENNCMWNPWGNKSPETNNCQIIWVLLHVQIKITTQHFVSLRIKNLKMITQSSSYWLFTTSSLQMIRFLLADSIERRSQWRTCAVNYWYFCLVSVVFFIRPAFYSKPIQFLHLNVWYNNNWFYSEWLIDVG